MSNNTEKENIGRFKQTPLENRLLCILVRNTILKENDMQVNEKIATLKLNELKLIIIEDMLKMSSHISSTYSNLNVEDIAKPKV